MVDAFQNIPPFSTEPCHHRSKSIQLEASAATYLAREIKV